MTTSTLIHLLSGARIYDLEQPRRFGDPVFPTHQPGTIFTLHRRHEPGGEPRTSASGLIITAEHAGTHIDALCHQAEHLTLHGGLRVIPAVQTPTGFTRLGIETVAPILARGVLIDLARHSGGLAPDHTLVTVADLDAARRAQGVDIRRGDVVLVRTGNDALWGDPERYLRGPGMAAEVSEWLAAQQVRAVGADNVAWDLPGHVDEQVGSSLPGHVILLVRHGIHIIENLYLAGLSAAAVFEFVFVCLPLKVVGGTGGPVRPIAVVAGESDDAALANAAQL